MLISRNHQLHVEPYTIYSYIKVEMNFEKTFFNFQEGTK